MKKDWDKLIEAALTTKKQSSFNVSIPLKIEGETWQRILWIVMELDILQS